MNPQKNLTLFILASMITLFGSSCSAEKEYSAYFGGQVLNPSKSYVIVSKGTTVIDSIPIQENNTFSRKFDSLTPGMYTFKIEPEYQYVYFDKNDSIVVKLDTENFDESIVFSGKGFQKNNYLIDSFLKNEKDKNKMYAIYFYDFEKFNKIIDSTYSIQLATYRSKKRDLKWSEDFDVYAKATVDFSYLSKKENYPSQHKSRTGNDSYDFIPQNYYDYRKTVDYNSVNLSTYLPFVNFLSSLLNNMAEIKYHNHLSNVDKELKTNINKLKIADTLIKNQNVKSTIINTIAFNYLLVDQNMSNNSVFMDAFKKISPESKTNEEILKIGNAIQQLKPGNKLPETSLIDSDGKSLFSDSLLKSKVVLYFYTQNAELHLITTHNKAKDLGKKHPKYKFIGICLDENQKKWTNLISIYDLNVEREFRTGNFNQLKDNWALTKINRTIILDENGIIHNAFTNLIDVNFESFLK